MAYYFDWVKLEMELSGVGAGWTDVSADLRMVDGVKWRRGIMGSGPTDRVARPGVLTFTLNNAATNSAGTVGYYSPDHASVRSGFGFGIRVRLRTQYLSSAKTAFIGWLDDIEVEPGSSGERKVFCTVVDWFEMAARHQLRAVALQTGKRADECIEAVLADMDVQPIAKSLGQGISTFAYALTGNGSSFALAELQRLMQTEGGQLWQSGDGTLRFQNRHTRATTVQNQLTFSDSTNKAKYITVQRKRDRLIRRVLVTAHPRRVDSTLSTLYTLRATMLIPAGQSVTLLGSFSDPAQQAAKVSGFDMVAPVATTDYTMNTASDGSGTDLTASFSVSTSYGANGHLTTITNGAAVDGYVTTFKCRGKGIYDYEAVTAVAENAADVYGGADLSIDLPYESDPAVAQACAEYNLALYTQPRTFATAVTFLANKSQALLILANKVDVSTRIGIDETVSALASAGVGGAELGFWVNGIEAELTERNVLTMTWTLAPADLYSVWVLETSALDVDARLAF